MLLRLNVLPFFILGARMHESEGGGAPTPLPTGTYTQDWVVQFGSSAADYATAVAACSDGSVFVGGYTSGDMSGSNAGGTDAWFSRYDSTGNLQWTKQFGTENDDTVKALSCDSFGHIYVGGTTEGDLYAENIGWWDNAVTEDIFLGRPCLTDNAAWLLARRACVRKTLQ